MYIQQIIVILKAFQEYYINFKKEYIGIIFNKIMFGLISISFSLLIYNI